MTWYTHVYMYIPKQNPGWYQVPYRLPGSRGAGGRILRIASPSVWPVRNAAWPRGTENGWIFVRKVGMCHYATIVRPFNLSISLYSFQRNIYLLYVLQFFFQINRCIEWYCNIFTQAAQWWLNGILNYMYTMRCGDHMIIIVCVVGSPVFSCTHVVGSPVFKCTQVWVQPV